ncbi:hypothetical protein VH96_13075 [Acinetobacter indicus]|uniref:restriction endonuclease subunit S n=1 Tax=Acinetobacter indicus TaxID=756892 RepID=UPI0005F85081|nr:restriction endonuclease subunit S [Acinetobacter indicus]KJV41770.1 hypothetical protein VH96_13075 [Acinetobacter indicus]
MSVSFEKLQDIAKVIDSLHKTPKYSETGYSMVRCTDVKYGFLNLQGTFKVSKAIFDEFSKRYEPSRNDIVITRVGTYGVTALVQDTEFCLGQNTSVIIAKKINPKYLYAVLNSPILKNQIEASVVGSTQKTLSLKAINNFEIPRFSPVVEDQIAKMISELDEKIHLNNQINQTLESIAQAIFKSWFVDFDPVRAKIAAKQEGNDPELAAMCAISGKSEEELQQMAEDDLAELRATASLFPDELVESELGEVPKGWEVKRFEDLLDTLESGTRPKGGVSGISEGIPSVGAENILGLGIYNYGKEKFVPYSFFEKMKKGKVQDYDVLLYKDGGKPGEFKPRVSMFGKGFPYEEFSINEHVFRIRSTKLEQFFLYFKIKSPDILSQLASKGAKAAIPGINQNDVKSLYISCPTDNILEKFNSSVESLINLILKNSLENKSLAKLRDGLLPKLLSGEIEVENL